ncbi:MAG: bi-domain-containing oxidoreductase [Proteobacteria bacterium]|nr:bi-domain-containing oxidoreductase [Pseudomonadota bacterium]
MKQILQHPRSGRLELVEVPAPDPGPRQVLVRNCFSVMSPGTDKLTMDFARKSLLAKARSRPDLVQQVVRKLQQEGPIATYRTVTTRLDSPQPMGYSCAGVVEAVGAQVQTFRVGDRVACAGAGYASHAELVVVPENLVVPVPAGVPLEHATFATIGAIALQGVRVAEPTLGEVAAVIGLGLIGQISVQLLRANGCKVLGIDLDEKRVKQALDQGATWAETPDSLSSSWKDEATNGHGVDLALVTASADTAAPLHQAAELCRKKGRIAFVGATPMELDRRTMYEKELDLRMSTAYGPGRYDRAYEELGLDYPISYVRWTENRNLRAFLDLTAAGQLHPDRLDTRICPIEESIPAYEDLLAGRGTSLAVIFRYGEQISRERTLPLRPRAPKRRSRDLGVGFLGAGHYAKAVLLPILDRTRWIDRLTLVTATGASARGSAEKFGFRGCGTDPDAVLKDPNVELVFIATRHNSHAALTNLALDAGKAVWVEKPVALDSQQLGAVAATATRTGGLLAVGFNRRFSPHSAVVKELFARRQGPIAIHYNVAAGPPPANTWIVDPVEGGGRIVGEVCHFVDLCNFLAGDLPCSVYARGLGSDPEVDDSVVAVLGYPDGSTATIEYLARTSTKLPKERFEVSGDGLTARCDNFRQTIISGRRPYRTFNQDKGQANAVRKVVEAVRKGDPSPFALDELLSVSKTTFAIPISIARGEPVPLERD